MPETIINIPVQQVASMISSMTENEIETLLILLSEQGEEIRERDADLKQGRVFRLIHRSFSFFVDGLESFGTTT